MTDISNKYGNRRALHSTARQVAAILAGIAAVVLVLTTFLSFVSNECERGAPFIPQWFVCFPAK